jgi:large repetitive protein
MTLLLIAAGSERAWGQDGKSAADPQVYDMLTGANSPMNSMAFADDVMVISGDFDCDGDVDLHGLDAVFSPHYWANDGSGAFTDVAGGAGDPFRDLAGASPMWDHSKYVFPADYDGDGDTDILTTRYDAAGQNEYFRNDCSGGNIGFTQLSSTNSPFSGIGIQDDVMLLTGDFDCDLDIDLHTWSEGGITAGFFQNNAGVFSDKSADAIENPFFGLSDRAAFRDHAKFAKPADYDGDGDLDVWTYQLSAAGDNTFFENTCAAGPLGFAANTGTSSPFFGVGTIADGVSVVVGDFDGNGSVDLHTWDGASTDNDFWANNGSGTFTKTNSAPENPFVELTSKAVFTDNAKYAVPGVFRSGKPTEFLVTRLTAAGQNYNARARSVPTITISMVAGDDIINASEDNSAVIIPGTTANVEDGRQVTVALNGKAYTGAVGTNAWSVTVPANDVQGLDASELVTADVSDALNVAAAQATRTITYDTTPPTIAIALIAGDDLINAAETAAGVTISGTAEGADGRPVTVTLNSKTYTGPVTTGAWSVTVPPVDAAALPASTSVLADVSDLAGNPATQASRAITFDGTAPSGYTVSITQGAVNAANASVVSLTLAGAEVDATYNYTISSTGGGTSVTGSGTIATATDQITGIDLSGLADGTLIVLLTLADSSGNTGQAVTDIGTKDTVAPTGYTVSMDQDPINDGNQSAVSFTFAGAEVGTTYNYVLSDGTTAKGTGADVTGSGTITSPTEGVSGIDLSGQSDGTTTLTVSLTDLAGNTGAGATATATRDTSAPSGYTVSIDQDPITAVSQSAVSFTFAGAEVGATYNYTFSDAGAPKAAGTDVSGSGIIATMMDQVSGIDLSGHPSSTATLTVTLTDLAGNTGDPATDTSFIDLVAPDAPGVPDLESTSDLGESDTDNITSSLQPVISGTSEAGGTVELTSSLDGLLGSTVANGAGTWSFVPTADLSEGSHSLTATVTDSAGLTSGSSGPAIILVDATGPATSGAAPVSVLEDAADTGVDLFALWSDGVDTDAELAFTLLGTTNAGLFASSVVDDASGTLTLDYGADQNGSSEVTVRVTDRAGNIADEVIAVAVQAVNDPPELSVPTSQSTEEDATLIFSVANGNAITVTDVDAGGSSLSVSMTATSSIDLGSTGTISITGGADGSSAVSFSGTASGITAALDGMGYTPTPGATGTGTLTITVDDGGNTGDGGALSATEIISIALTPVAGAPVAGDDTATTFSGESVTIFVLANDTDAEGDVLSIVSVSTPSDGTASANADGSITYTASAFFVGTVTFTYTVADTGGATDTATATVNINAAGPDGDGVSDDVEDGGPNGGDGNGDSIPDSEQVNVTSIPVASGDNAGEYLTIVSPAGTSLIQVVSAPIPAPDQAPAVDFPLGLVAFEVQGLALGASTVVTIVLPSGVPIVSWWMYGPTAAQPTDHWYEFGWDGATGAIIHVETALSPPSVDLHFIDGQRGDHDLTANGVIVDPGVPIFETNSLPVAVGDAGTLDEDTSISLSVLENDSDADGDPISVVSVGPPENGSAEILPDGQISYIPDPDFHGSDSFVYQISDGRTSAVEALITVDVLPIQDPPVAVADSAATAEEVPVTFAVIANDFDVDGDDISLVTLGAPSGGEAVPAGNGSVTYTPRDDFSGTDTFTYTISDTFGNLGEGMITVVVTGTNDIPVALPDEGTTSEDSSVILDVLANDTDADGDPLLVVSFVQPEHGTVVVNAEGALVYTPEPDYSGDDAFSYVVGDGQAEGAPVTVTLVVTAENDAPVFAGDAITGPTSPFVLAVVPYEASYQAATDVDDTVLTHTWELALDASFLSVVYSVAVEEGTFQIDPLILIGVLEANGLAVGQDLETFQHVVAQDDEGARGESPAQAIVFSRGTAVGTETGEDIPEDYYLASNYPNPFNPQSTLSFGLPEPVDVLITLYDMTGRQVLTLINEPIEAGNHLRRIDLSQLPSGVYLYRMVAGEHAFTKTLHLIK